MKLFWRPSRIPTALLVLVAAMSVGLYVLVEAWKTERPLPDYDLKIRAAQRCEQAFKVIRKARLAARIRIDSELDPTNSGLVGVTVSHITSKAGQLQAKQATLNPNWAAVFVDMYRKAGLEAGDRVAVGVSGSLPALNIAALAAAEVMELEPLVISSVSSSMWGANHPRLTWLDMETALRVGGIVDVRSLAASLGGMGDRGIGLPKKGINLLRKAMERNEVPEILGETLEELIAGRIRAYEEAAQGNEIAAYVNVGGGIASVGSLKAKKKYRAGVNFRPPEERGLGQDGVMEYFGGRGVPVVHAVRIRRMAALYDLPWQFQGMPKPGQGGVYRSRDYNTWLVWGALLLILASLVAITRVDVTFAMRRVFGSRSSARPPGPAV